jgi:CDP-diacylglycerol--glycerol-3-phosphate 3-phosphatidyltransferase
MLDGQVARLSGRVTSFGGFLDSSLDRLSDMVVFVGLMCSMRGRSNTTRH